MEFNHYIGIDWSQAIMAFARMTGKSDKIEHYKGPTDIGGLQAYLDRLHGTKKICFEETDTAQWLYTELKTHADEIIVCDPYRNRLLSDGPKDDPIDAGKLVQLLRANMLKPVFHAGDELFYVRKLVSAYDDVVCAGVRLQNQRSALLRAVGARNEADLESAYEKFIFARLEESVNRYREEKSLYEEQFDLLRKKHARIRHLASIPGIATIHATQILAMVIDIGRFETKGKFLAYCGLVKHQKLSGGKSYGKRLPRYSRKMKCIMKVAAFSCLKEFATNDMKAYYDYLINEKRYPDHIARHKIARRIAILVYGILKSGRAYKKESDKKAKNELKN